MKEFEIDELAVEGAKFSCHHIKDGPSLLFLPKDAPEELKRQYLEYGFPSHIKELAVKLAETLLFESVSVHNAGLAGSLARNEEAPFSDVDMLIFTKPFLARKFAYQTPMIDVYEAKIVDVYTLVGIQEEKITEILSTGIPVAQGIEFRPIDLHPILLSDTYDEDVVNLYSRFDPKGTGGLSFLASLGKDLLMFEPEERSFLRPENHWLIDLYKFESESLKSGT